MSTISCAAAMAALGLALGCGEKEGPPTPGADAGNQEPACPAKLVLQGAGLAGPGVEHDAIQGEEHWKAADSPHFLSPGTTFISEGATVIVDPCAVVVAREGALLQVAEQPGFGGTLIATGTDASPILFTGAAHVPDQWYGILIKNGGTVRFSHVVLEDAGLDSAAIRGEEPGATLGIDHSILRHGAGNGIRLQWGAGFALGSEANTITGFAGSPIVIDLEASSSIPDGDYTGNGDDRIWLEGTGAVVPQELGPITWHKRSVPYVYHIGSGQYWETSLTLEPGTRVDVNNVSPDADLGTWFFRKGAGIHAVGTPLARIVIQGDHGTVWEGFDFDPFWLGQEPPGASTFAFVTLRDADSPLASGGSVCSDQEQWSAAITLGSKSFLSMTGTEIWGVTHKSYGVARDYEGDGAADFGADPTNVFHAPMACPETDQIEASQGCPQSCCGHAYACRSEVLP